MNILRNGIKPKMKLLLVTLALLTAPVAAAATNGNLLIKGKVLSFDRYVVQLQTETGLIRVPRKKIVNEKEIRPNQSAEASVTVNDLYYLN